MKIAFFSNQKEATTYTHELLKFLAQKGSHEICSMSDANIIGVSLTSHYEIEDLKRVRKQFPNKKIIAGGHASNAPAPLLRWADYVNCGQGFEFFQDCKTIEDIEGKEYIATREKNKIKYSQIIDWNILPVVQTSKNSWGYWESSGCENKCKFCLTSWMNNHERNPNRSKMKLIKRKLGNKQISFLGNSYDNLELSMNVANVTVKNYLRDYRKYSGIRLIRLGVESPNYDTRKFFSKKITDDQLKTFFEITKQTGKQCNLYFIAGLDDQEKWESFTSVLPYATMCTSPSIGIIINYFDPSVMTPLERFDMRKIIPINIPKIKRLWKLHNGRIRIYRDHKISWKMNLLDCMMQRSHWDEIEKILELKKITYHYYEDLLNDIEKAKLFHLVTGEHKKLFELI